MKVACGFANPIALVVSSENLTSWDWGTVEMQYAALFIRETASDFHAFSASYRVRLPISWLVCGAWQFGQGLPESE